jgi:hypothetical protein
MTTLDERFARALAGRDDAALLAWAGAGKVHGEPARTSSLTVHVVNLCLRMLPTRPAVV